jgi:hypothetical protein
MVTIGYGSKTLAYYTAIGSGAQANGICNIAIGANCINSTQSLIKFWFGFNSTSSYIAGVQFGNVVFGISGTNLTIQNATSFDVRPT